MVGETSDDFQKELVELFVQEAQEWLQNIHVALDELQQGPEADRHAELIGILTGGVTNLGGSAATINLHEVERASFAAVPFIDALRDPQKSFSVQDFLSLCKQLGQIQAALTRATGVTFDAHEAGAEVSAATVSPGDLLKSLRGVQSVQPGNLASDRSVIATMIDQMEAQIKAGVQQVGIDVIQEYLKRMSDSEEAFIKSVDASVSGLIERLGALADSPSSPDSVLGASLQEVTQLQAEARQVNAVQAMAFFSGLQSVLAIVDQKRVRLAVKKTQAITGRLLTVREGLHQWVERGRVERSAIGQLLSATQ